MSSVLPHDLEAERAVFTAILGENELLYGIAELLKKEDFFLDAHQRIFEAMRRVSSDSKPLNPDMLSHALRNEPAFEEIGGRGYLRTLEGGHVTREQAIECAETIREKALRRRLIEEARQIVEECVAEGIAFDGLLDHAIERLLKVRELKQSKTLVPVSRHIRNIFSTVERMYEKQTSQRYVSTGLTAPDEATGGLRSGNVTLLAGDSGKGRTSLALHFARTIALEVNMSVAFFPLVQSGDEITSRLISAGSGIPHRRLRSGRLMDSDWAKLAREADRLFRAPLFLGDARRTTVMEIRSKGLQLKAKHGQLGLIVVDDLQLLPEASQSLSDVCSQLKEIAQELEVPVVVTVALRSISGSAPALSDLRNVGLSARDAELILFLQHSGENTDANEIVDMLIARQENGPPGVVQARFHPDCLRFENLS